MYRRNLQAVLLCAILVIVAVVPASAHQPYFEESDLTADSPYKIADISISLAFYGSLTEGDDVDYFVFDGKAQQPVFLSLVIPFIEGQETFTPTLAWMGPGLDAIRLPKPVVQPANSGALILRAAPGKPAIFYEPFGARNYYKRQEQTITLPADGRYTVAIWSESGQTGRYTFSPGKREIFGGDRDYWQKSQAFWTTLPTPVPTAISSPLQSSSRQSSSRQSSHPYSCGD